MRTSFNVEESIWTWPSWVPRKSDSDPEVIEERDEPYHRHKIVIKLSEASSGHTSKRLGSGAENWVTSKKLKTFHY